MAKKKRKVHPKKTKQFKSKESYRKFRAYVHMRTPTGKLAPSKSQTISAKTPRSHKEPVVKVGGKRHTVKLSPQSRKKKRKRKRR